MSYDPTLGRFIEMDPAMYIDGPNMYQMERSNPVRLTDPFGLEGGDSDSDQIALKIFNHGIGVEEKAGNRLSALHEAMAVQSTFPSTFGKKAR